jgi:hypothetical protein
MCGPPPHGTLLTGSDIVAIHMIGVVILLFVLASAELHAQELCQQLTKCRRQGNDDCDRTVEACPPCMYSGVRNAYLCYDKAADTNTCPYTGVVYDCSTWTQQDRLHQS